MLTAQRLSVKDIGLKARLLRLGRKSRSLTEYLKGTNIRITGRYGEMSSRERHGMK